MVIAFLGTPVHSGLNGLVQMVETAGAIERVALWQRAILGWLGMTDSSEFFTLPKFVVAYAARIAFLGMFLAQGWAFWLAWKGAPGPFWKWMIGPVCAHLVMVLMPPSNADVFFYEITGDLAHRGINPYVYQMSEFPTHPLLPYNHWVDLTAVYGPVWTGFNRTLMWITGPDPVVATLVYKGILGVSALLVAVLVYWFVLKLTSTRRLAQAAGVLVAWQPNFILESTGLAHNDPIIILLSTCGIALAILGGTRAIRGGIVLVTVSALVKYTSMPLLGILGLARLADRKQPGSPIGVVRSWVLDALAIAAVTIAAFGAYWAGVQTLQEMITEPGRLFSSPIYLYPKVGLEHIGPDSIAHRFESIASVVIQLLAIGIVLATMLWFGKTTWALARMPQPAHALPIWTRPLLASWAVIMTTLALLPVNSHPWYWTWPVAPIAVLVCYDAGPSRDHGPREPALPRWFWSYLIVTGIMTIAYHTRIVHP
jgi:hypothetical protein